MYINVFILLRLFQTMYTRLHLNREQRYSTTVRRDVNDMVRGGDK